MTEKQEYIIEKSLACFVKKGLLGTNMADLGNAVGIRQGGLYYHFSSKEEIVLSCADLAVRQLENRLLAAAMKDVKDPDKLIVTLETQAKKNAPIMHFLVSVAVSRRYREKMKPTLKEFSSRYEAHAERLAKALDCELDEVRALSYTLIVSVVNFMIFGEETLFYQQMRPIVNEIRKLRARIQETN